MFLWNDFDKPSCDPGEEVVLVFWKQLFAIDFV